MPTLSNKGTITKELCKVLLETAPSKSMMIFGAIISLLGALNIVSSLIFSCIIIAIGFAVIFIGYKKYNEAKKGIEQGNYYLVQDVVVKAKERRVSTKSSARNNIFYIFTFKDHGDHIISRSSSRYMQIKLSDETESLDLNDEALKYFCEGERFHLLILDLGYRKQTVQIFNVCYYDIDTNEFTESGGKYYPKLS